MSDIGLIIKVERLLAECPFGAVSAIIDGKATSTVVTLRGTTEAECAAWTLTSPQPVFSFVAAQNSGGVRS